MVFQPLDKDRCGEEFLFVLALRDQARIAQLDRMT